jgi:hypothetical protein
MDRLYAQLHVWAGTLHEWSYCDCYMVVADWVRIVTGVDPGEELRGTYGDPDVCPRARALRADPVPVGRCPRPPRPCSGTWRLSMRRAHGFCVARSS